jgi:hypothetical protein
LDLAAVVFGVGLSMALDEWVYLITTDGSNASYLLPISFWGGAVMIGLASGYLAALYLSSKRTIDSKTVKFGVPPSEDKTQHQASSPESGTPN